MARSFASSSSQYLSYSTTSLAAEPLTMAAWVYPLQTNTNGFAVALGNNGSFGFYGLGFISAGQVVAQKQIDPGGVNGIATASVGYAANAWSHGAAVFVNDTSRVAYINGGSAGSDTTNVADPTPDFLAIGSLRRASASNYLNGRVAHAALWQAALTADEVASLYNNGIGADPRSIRPDALVAYWPLLDNDGDADWWGQYNLTAVNSPTYADHPPVLMRSRSRVFVPAPVGVGSHTLVIQDATSETSADNLALIEGVALAIDDATSASEADNLSLAQGHMLSIADALSTTTVDALVLSQGHVLTIADALSPTLADNLMLSTGAVVALRPREYTPLIGDQGNYTRLVGN